MHTHSNHIGTCAITPKIAFYKNKTMNLVNCGLHQIHMEELNYGKT